MRRYAPHAGPKGLASGVFYLPLFAYHIPSSSLMYICYVDESGVEQLEASTSHFVYLGLAVPAETWKTKDKQVSAILANYDLAGEEIHAGWILRRYTDQERIPGFETMDGQARRAAVEAERRKWLIQTAALKNRAQKGDYDGRELFGMLVHDNNQTVALKLTDMMRRFHVNGTFRWDIDNIIETPLFVDSGLTAMIQIADLCAYATRRFFENGETDLFNRFYARFDRTGARVVGIRHYRHNHSRCNCRVCVDHTK